MRGQPELRIKVVNFLELIKYEKTALKTVCVAHEGVSRGREVEESNRIHHVVLSTKTKQKKKKK